MSIVIADSRRLYNDFAGQIKKKLNMAVYLLTEKNKLNFEFLNEKKPAYIFFTHWSYIIPEEIFSQFNCVIFHMTDLPFGRGGSPLQNLISREIYETKISAIQCIKELDAGPIYLKKSLSLQGNAEEIYIRANKIMFNMILEIIERKLLPQAQMGAPVIFKRRLPIESNIEGLPDLEKIFDYIRMLDADGYPKAFLEIGNIRLEFCRASFKGDKILADVEIRIKNYD